LAQVQKKYSWGEPETRIDSIWCRKVASVSRFFVFGGGAASFEIGLAHRDVLFMIGD